MPSGRILNGIWKIIAGLARGRAALAHGAGIIRAMTAPPFAVFAAAMILLGLGACSSIKPAELLDERTGMTVGALAEPIELVESAHNAALVGGKRVSFAYLGPVEWDRSGELTYALWIHVAPGNDKPIGPLASKNAVIMALDSGTVTLSPVEDPIGGGGGPYHPVAPWGQTGYFALDATLLKRMAASATLELEFRGLDDGRVDFKAGQDTRSTLTDFLRARGITDD